METPSQKGSYLGKERRIKKSLSGVVQVHHTTTSERREGCNIPGFRRIAG
jgi:hypothetical protein